MFMLAIMLASPLFQIAAAVPDSLMFSHTMHRVFNSLTAILVWAGMKTPHSVDFTLWE
jgi:hypothetical protein